MSSLPRTPEPEVMDGEAQSEAYANADFSESNQRFVDLFATYFPEIQGGVVLDLGCGPADIPVRLATRLKGVEVWGLDGSAPMLALGRAAIEEAQLGERVRLFQGLLPGVLDVLPPGFGFSAAISNSLLHHLHDPGVLWRELLALRASNNKNPLAVLVVDLMRPATHDAALAVVERYADKAPEVLRRDFLCSLHAAFTADEVREQLAANGLDLQVEVISDRHLCARGLLV